MAQTGNLYVIAAPSGAGKTSLVKALVESMDNISVSISHTTRAIRPGEEDGINYFFVDKAKFDDMIKNDEFLEHAKVFDRDYGTSKQWVEDMRHQGVDVILEIDWQGHQQIKKLFPGSISIFILPPSLEDLRERLVKRNQDHPDVIEQRMADVRDTVSHVDEFDYLVLNDTFEHAVHDLTTIIEAGRLLETAQRRKYASLIERLAVISAS
jgi:guanylate kinase